MQFCVSEIAHVKALQIVGIKKVILAAHKNTQQKYYQIECSNIKKGLNDLMIKWDLFQEYAIGSTYKNQSAWTE